VRVEARAHAKLTLSLSVLGRRPDGFHDVEVLAVSLAEPCDEVVVSRLGDEPRVILVGEARHGDAPSGSDNLAVRAAAAVVEASRADAGLAVELVKRIPVEAGLGGGSADAAAALVATARLLGDDAASVDLPALAAALGSDVPFCLSGGVARLSGRGERVQPVDPAGDVGVVLVTPDLRCPTAAVYAAWDDLGGPRSERTVVPPAGLVDAGTELVNDLEPAALAVAPGLARFRDALADATGAAPLLAGSGSTYFVLHESTDLASAAVRDVEDVLRGAGIAARLVIATHPVAHGVELAST
jgi:4-diphosphocytidyl-2-C-methyl-D-erythritol kinase